MGNFLNMSLIIEAKELEDKLMYFIPKKYGINHLVKFFSYKMIFHTYFLIFFHKKIWKIEINWNWVASNSVIQNYKTKFMDGKSLLARI